MYVRVCAGVKWLWELHTQRAGGIVGDEMGASYLHRCTEQCSVSATPLLRSCCLLLWNWACSMHRNISSGVRFQQWRVPVLVVTQSVMLLYYCPRYITLGFVFVVLDIQA